MTHRSRRLLASLAAALLVVGACSDSGDDATTGPTGDPTAEPPGETTREDTTTVDGSTATSAVTLDADEICARLTTESVAAELGIEVLRAVPGESATPQCAYEYEREDGSLSNVTVAAIGPADVGGAVGEDAFDAVVELNVEVAGSDADQQELDAGDNATRLSGTTLHLGIVQVGDHVYTLIVPVGDADPDEIDRLIATMATTLG